VSLGKTAGIVLFMNLKLTIASLAMTALLFPTPARAADARTFEGVNLDDLRQAQQMRDLLEIYERDPANRRRYRLQTNVVQLPLGAAWLTFNAERAVSYLNKVPGENAATFFGPIAGDAFELFHLEDRFIAQLREDYAGDVSYRLDLMLRTSHETLRERALRIMTAGLAADIPAEIRANHVAKFKQLSAELEGGDVGPLREAIAQTEQRIEELTVTFPADVYTPGNDELARQGKLLDWMKPGVPVPDAAWGKVQEGLRAAAVFSTVAPRLDQEVSVWLLVENTSTQEVRFASSDVMQSAQPRIRRADGTQVEPSSSWFTGLSPIERHKLRPGERLTLAKKTLSFGNKNGADRAGFGSSRVTAGPGEYWVRYESVLTPGSAWGRQDDGLMHRTMPAKGEWQGWLTTAETKLTVPRAPAAAGPAGEVESTPARPSGNRL
jgi:hypothetical protein